MKAFIVTEKIIKPIDWENPNLVEGYSGSCNKKIIVLSSGNSRKEDLENRFEGTVLVSKNPEYKTGQIATFAKNCFELYPQELNLTLIN